MLGRAKESISMKSAKQAVHCTGYVPSDEEYDRLLESPNAILENISRLNLTPYNEGYSYFEISTQEDSKSRTEPHDWLCDTRRRIAEHIFGRGTDFNKYMALLREQHIDSVRIYFMNPEYFHRLAHGRRLGYISNLDSIDPEFNSNPDEWKMASAFRPVGMDTDDGRHRRIMAVPRKAKSELLYEPEVEQPHPDCPTKALHMLQVIGQLPRHALAELMIRHPEFMEYARQLHERHHPDKQ